MRFAPFDDSHVAAVKDFNRRMLAGHADSEFLLATEPDSRVRPAEDPIQWTQYVVLDGEDVRGGVITMDQPGWVNGRSIRAVNFQSPLSEGIVDPKYTMVALQLVKFMQKQGEAGYFAGMGSSDRPLAKLLSASGWWLRPLPFLFRVHRAGNVLRELRMLQTTLLRRTAASAARFSGIGACGLAVMQRRRNVVRESIRQVTTWGDWADEIWQCCRAGCSFAVQRDRRTLESLYPTSDPKTKILLIERHGNPVGWSVCFNARLSNHRHFGNLQLASILDCMAQAEAMIATAVLTDREMSSQGADLVVVNHGHADWVKTFRSAGFLSGPSNYLLAMTKRMTELVLAVPHGADHIHVTRGDGDGRIHLA